MSISEIHQNNTSSKVQDIKNVILDLRIFSVYGHGARSLYVVHILYSPQEIKMKKKQLIIDFRKQHTYGETIMKSHTII